LTGSRGESPAAEDVHEDSDVNDDEDADKGTCGVAVAVVAAVVVVVVANGGDGGGAEGPVAGECGGVAIAVDIRFGGRGFGVAFRDRRARFVDIWRR